MKLFLNDWSGDRGTFVWDVEENREYRVDEWLWSGDGLGVFLASVYVYDEFVMFFYVGAIDVMREYLEHSVYEAPRTNRDWVVQPRGDRSFSSFKYVVNGLESRRGGGGACLPSLPDMPLGDDVDEFTKMHYEEYDYLLGLVKDRLPAELRGVMLAFRKDCYSFEKPVDEIEHLAIFPNNHETNYYFVDKSFALPFGACDTRVEYLAGEVQSYVIFLELKVYDMLEVFEEQYSEIKKSYEESLLAWEERGCPAHEGVVSLDEMREFYDKRLLVLSYLVPEEHRSLECYLKEYLDSEISTSSTGSVWFYSADEDDKFVDGLFKRETVLCEMDDEAKNEYEITLMWALDSVQHERKAIFDRKL